MAFSTLIRPQQLAPHIADEDWAIIDCRFDLSHPESGRQQYEAGHIPGAVYAHLEQDLSSAPDGRHGRHPLPDVAALAGFFSRCGIDAGVQVVAYDSDSGGYAARLWWLLRFAGHDRVAVLDGGLPAWQRAGLEQRAGIERRPARTFVFNPRPELVASTADVLAAAGSDDSVLIDSRAPERYRGESEPIDPVAGHIPGARNHHWQLNLQDTGELQPVEALRSAFEAVLTGRPAEQAIVYCGSGVTACQNLLSLEHAGLHGARLYPDSWSGWICDPGRPVEVSS